MRIDKSYRPELLAEECFLDAKTARLIAASARALVALPVALARREVSGTVSAAALRAARARRPCDAQATVRAGGMRGARAPHDVPDWRRGSPGAVTLVVNVSELKRLSDALGVVVVAITGMGGAGVHGALVVQPVDAGALEFGVLFGAGPREPRVRRRVPRPRPRRNLDGWADELLEDAGDAELTTRAIA